MSSVFLPVPGLAGQMQPSPVKKSTLASSLQACSSDWGSQDDGGSRQNFVSTDHAPLSPQSSIASSGSEQTEEQGSARNTFQEDGSGMKGQKSSDDENRSLSIFSTSSKSNFAEINTPTCIFILDVPTWLKSLRLHKYASLFSQMTYEEMMILTEQHLESQVSELLPHTDFVKALIRQQSVTFQPMSHPGGVIVACGFDCTGIL